MKREREREREREMGWEEEQRYQVESWDQAGSRERSGDEGGGEKSINI